MEDRVRKIVWPEKAVRIIVLNFLWCLNIRCILTSCMIR